MIRNIISEQEKNNLERDGFIFEYRGNMLTIRNYDGVPKVEIIYLGEEDILLCSEEEFHWVREVKSIISAYGNILCIAWGNNDSDSMMC